MKLAAIAALVLLLAPIRVYSRDADPEELLEKVDVSHPYRNRIHVVIVSL
jgi:hypothetical protein